MAEFETADDRRAIVVPSLRLEFRWAADRWTHAIDGVSESGLVRIVRAIEGDPDRDDPARVVSPAYQQLHFQSADGLAQALLVGQSGLHHFSAVFTLREGTEGVGV